MIAAAPAVTIAVGAAGPQSVDPQSVDQPITNQSAIGNQQPAPSRLFTLDVVVTDARGRAVEDLKPSDFELREDTTVLPLES
ncbi:MAG TPA: hypothetical protein VNG89_07725, partial [Vicinamibacterales bacterium]|nr:hypothetical protein [Vicinamibacterales bacterium]